MDDSRADRRAAMRGLRLRGGSDFRQRLNALQNPQSRTVVTSGSRRVPAGPVSIPTSHEPMKVFRIEHPESGQGPFTHDAGRGRFASDAMVYLVEPQEMCSHLRSGSGYHYAFESMPILMAAIQSFVLLREYGFHISVYDSNEHIVLPDGQVAFDLDKATKVESHQMHEFPFENYF